MFLGYTIAGISVIGAVRVLPPRSIDPCWALGLPIMDTAFVIEAGLAVAVHSTSLTTATPSRLLSRGFDQRRAAALYSE